MRPLIYLAFKTFVNGIKRAVGSPKRLIGLLFTVIYFGWYIFGRTLMYGQSPSVARGPWSRSPIHFDFPIERVLDGLFFGGFLLLTVPLVMSVASYNRVMRPADVDVLFPTPVSPKVVMGFRVVRDYMGALLFPLVILLFSQGSIPIASIVAAVPAGTGAGLGRSLVLSWLLLALTWISIGYATTLFINRSDLASDRNKRILDWGLVIFILGTAAYITLCLRQEFSWANALNIAESPLLRVLYLPATLATSIGLGALPGGVGLALVSFLALVAIIVMALNLAMSQVGWMYDQAAVKGFETSESQALRKSGDMAGVMAHQARMGKLKAGKPGRLQRIKATGPWALLWREVILQMRTAKTGFIFALFLPILYSLIPIFIFTSLPNSPRSGAFLGPMILGFQSLGIFIGSMVATQTGFVEFLRRVDLLKPLPFSALALVVAEMFSKSIITISVSWFGSLVALIIKPEVWASLLGSVIFVPTLAGVIAAASMVVLLTFPEIDDPSQRSFRGLMMLLAIAVSNLPGLLALIGFTVFTGQLLVGCLVGAALNAVCIVGLGYLAGNLYMDFNPSE